MNNKKQTAAIVVITALVLQFLASTIGGIPGKVMQGISDSLSNRIAIEQMLNGG